MVSSFSVFGVSAENASKAAMVLPIHISHIVFGVFLAVLLPRNEALSRLLTKVNFKVTLKAI